VLTSAHEPLPLADSLRAAAPRPVLLIAAGNVADERSVATRLRDASPKNVSLWIAPNAAHTAALHVDHDEWVVRVSTFLRGALFSTPSVW
jgi:hypothetical protein